MKHTTLRRELGLVDAVGIGLGAIVGAGIFVVSGVAAGIAGTSFLVGLAIAGVAATCNALTSAELAALYPESGGTYEYGYSVLHPAAGFAAGWMFLASKLAAAGAVAIGFGSYASKLVPQIDPQIAALAAVVLLTTVNLLGVRKAGRINTIIVAISIASLLAFVLLGIPSFDATNLQPFAPRGLRGIFEAAAVMFFAYTGYARIATLGEEVTDPARTIPRAIILTIVTAVALYACVALVAVGSVGAGALASSTSPLADAARTFDRPYAYWIVGIGSVTAMLGVLASQILGISRMMFAMARRRDLPSALAHVSSRHGVPDVGIVVTGAVVVIAVVFGALESVVATAAFTILLYYGIANVAALRLNTSQKRFHRGVAYTGLIACITLAFSLPSSTILTGFLLLAFGFVYRWIYKRLV